MSPNLEEAADVDFVVCVHEDHVLEQPEERPGVFLFGLQQLKDAVELKEQPASALCRRESVRQVGLSSVKYSQIADIC